jgi:hypothetical protein
MPNTFELIASSTVGSGGASSIDFTSIPSTYTDLCIKISVRGSYSGGGTADLIVSYNGSATSFTDRTLNGSGSAVQSRTNDGGGVGVWAGNLENASWTASTFGSIDYYIPNYAGSAYKSSSNDGVTENNATLAYANLVAGLWSNTAAINRVTITPSTGTLVEYSTAYLYGVKNA